MQILRTSLIPNPSPFPHKLSSSNTITTHTHSLLPKLSSLSLTYHHHQPPPSTVIRNGGGPRTFPGGVSKWQWKRMQSKKAKQLLKARLSRERNIYEMRKRAELKAAVSNLERPWEVIQKDSPSTSSLFSVCADEQLKVLADRFQKPGGFDLWSPNDGPQIFHTHQDLPSSRFFPKGVVHSVKPYGRNDVDVGCNPNSTRLKVESSNEGIDGKEVGSHPNRGKLSVGNSNYKGGSRKVKDGIDEKDVGSDPDGRPSSVTNSYYKDGNKKYKVKIDEKGVGPNPNRRILNAESSVSKVVNGKSKEVCRGGDDLRRIDRKRGQNWYGRDRNGKSLMDVKNLGRSDRGKKNGSVQNSGRMRRDVHGEDVYDMSFRGDGSYGYSGSKKS